MSRKKIEQVLDYQVVDKPIDEVKPDPTNPNVMSDEKFKALKLGLKEHFPYPVIVDQNGIIVDGFHRWKAWKELGNKTVPCIVQFCKNEIDRKIWRQIYNKVRGEHDKTKDKADFLAIFNAKRSSEFIKLLGTDKDGFLQLIGKKGLDNTEITTDLDPTEGYMKSFLHGNIKQITILMTNDEYKKIFPRFQKIILELKATNNTDGFFKLIESYENNKSKEKRS